MRVSKNLLLITVLIALIIVVVFYIGSTKIKAPEPQKDPVNENITESVIVFGDTLIEPFPIRPSITISAIAKEFQEEQGIMMVGPDNGGSVRSISDYNGISPDEDSLSTSGRIYIDTLSSGYLTFNDSLWLDYRVSVCGHCGDSAWVGDTLYVIQCFPSDTLK